MSRQGLGVRALTAGYPAQPAIVDGVELEVVSGSRLALLGANGSGKTTLLRCLSGALAPSSGAVQLDGEDLRYSRAALTRHRRRVQLVLQDPDDQLFSADVVRDVSFGPLNAGLDDAGVRRIVDVTLEELGIEHLRHRPTHQLSYGERKRVAIAGAVAMQPDFLLLDEPTAGLDPAGAAELLTVLNRLQDGGTTVVLSTHDVSMALEWADRVAVMDDGGVLQGDPYTVLGDHALMTRARLATPWAIVLGRILAQRGLLDAEERPRGLLDLERVLFYNT